MTRKDREIIRRLLKGDHLTSHKTDGDESVEEYFVGYHGNSPLMVDRRIAQHLIHNGYIDNISLAYNNASFRYQNVETDTDYILSTKTDRFSHILKEVSKYSLGDTVQYEHLHYGRGKGVITKELDPINSVVLLNGITNREFTVFSSVIGITRMVLIEKTIKKRVVVNNIKIENETRSKFILKKRDEDYYDENDEDYDIDYYDTDRLYDIDMTQID
ncbi:MAG: hypothetical protein Q8O88_04055 [bacterium]|nr:hypothetical protein [bacterium]